MPTYDYLCTGCGQTFEVFQKMSDEPLSSCPDCGAPARRRITGGTGFIFKGGGFYITDHRSQEYKDKAAAEAGKAKACRRPQGRLREWIEGIGVRGKEGIGGIDRRFGADVIRSRCGQVFVRQ